MRNMMKKCMGKNNKYLAVVLAVLMICNIVGGYFISDVVYANGAETVVYESLIETVNAEQVSVPHWTIGDLGQVSSITTGFKFKVTAPTTTDSGALKIFLYGVESEGNPWLGNGYMLYLEKGSTAGEVGWVVRKTATEELVAYNALTGVSGDELKVYTWLSDVDESTGAHTLNITINGETIVTYTNDGAVTTGVYMTAFNEWERTVEFKTIVENDVIPTDVVFEDLEQTMNLYSIAVTKGYNNLGKLEDQSHGFQFIVTRPGAEDPNMPCKIGLYNTSERNPWSDGYILALYGGNADGELSWAVLRGNGEGLLASGKLTGVEDEVMVSVWLSDINATTGEHKLNIIMDGREIVVHVDDGTTRLGKWLAAYNDMDTVLTIKTIKEIDVNPQDVVFEDLGHTAEKNKVSVPHWTIGDLGQVSSITTGFKFKVTAPTTTDSGTLKIFLYGVESEGNPWLGKGYMLYLEKGSTAGEVSWVVRETATEGLVAYNTLTGVSGDELMVYTWLSDVDKSTGAHTLHIVINDEEILAHTNAGTVVTGRYMTAFNEWSRTAEFKTIVEIDEGSSGNEGGSEDEDAYVIPTDVVFEDLRHTAKTNKVSVPHWTIGNLGRVSSITTGFKFKVTAPTTTDSGALKIFLYGIESEGNPWLGKGYTLYLEKGSTSGKAGWVVRETATNGLVAYNTLTGVSGDELKVYTWLSDVDESTGAHTLHIVINDEEVLAYTNAGTVVTGPYMTTFNEWSRTAEFKTITPFTEAEGDGYPKATVPSDVVFNDLGQTMNMNSISTVTRDFINLGELEDLSHGFQFIVTRPGAEEKGKVCKIGLYNTSKKDPWKDGYILVLAGGNADGELGWAVRRGKDEGLVAFGTLTGVADEVMVSVWLSDIDATTGAHTLNVIMDGREIVVHENGGTTLVGKWLAAYNEMDTVLTIKTIKEIKTVIDKYLEKMGDPTAKNDDLEADKGTEDEKDDSNVGTDDSISILPYILGGVIIVLIIAGAIIAIALIKNKKQISSEEQN